MPDDGSVVVIGGTRGLGLEVARNARRLVQASRGQTGTRGAFLPPLIRISEPSAAAVPAP